MSAPLSPASPSIIEFLCHAGAHKIGALGIAGGFVGLSMLIAAILPPSFSATATLAILPSPEFTVRAEAGSHEVNTSALALDQIMKVETEILDSDTLHAAALERLGPATLYPELYNPASASWLHTGLRYLLSPWRPRPADPEAARTQRALTWFADDLRVLPAKDSNVISVAFTSHNAASSAAAVNALLDLYASRRSRLYDDPQLAVVRRELQAGTLAVAQADRNLAVYKREQNITDYDQERDLLLRRRTQAETEASDSRAKASEHQARLDALSRALRAEPISVGLYRETDSDMRLQTAIASLQDSRSKLAVARERYRDTSRVVAALNADIAARESEVARLRHDGGASVDREGRNPSIDPLRLDHARVQAELAATGARLGAQERTQSEIMAALSRLELVEPGLLALQRQKAGAEENYRTVTRLLSERRLTEAEDALRLANVRIIQFATQPQWPRPIPLLVMAAGVLVGISAAFGWIVTIFVARPVFLTADGLEAYTGLPVLAVFNQAESKAFHQPA